VKENHAGGADGPRIVALGRWATVLVAILAVLLSVAAAVGTAVLISIVRHVPLGRLPLGLGGALEAFIVAPVLVLTLIVAIRRSGSDVLAYLGLDVPRWRHVGLAIAAVLVLIGFQDALALMLGRRTVDATQLEMVRLATADGSLILVLIAAVIAAPIHEEFLFRGFLFRGFVRTQRDAIPGILVISLLWTSLHFTQEWFSIATVFLSGLLLGFVRWQTGSTTLTIVLHMLMNLEATVELEIALR
jgi:uncharacterized protein